MYFPNKDKDDPSITQLPSNYLPSYEETGYARQHLWDEFLHAYYGVDPIEDSEPTIMFNEPTFNATVDRQDILMITGTAYDREMIDKVEIRIDGGNWRTLPGITGQGKVVWINQLDISDLDLGVHILEARAKDRPSNTEPGTPGHVTQSVKTQIFVIDSSRSSTEGFDMPPWVMNAFLIIVVIAALSIGAVIFRGRRG
jgi:hypothetical protein